MIQAFAALRAWLESKNIDPGAFKVVLLSDSRNVDRAALAFSCEMEGRLNRPGLEPIREGHIYGISFSIERVPSRREQLAADLDDACAVDVSAVSINRDTKDWWKT
jgi:hypothetical protein